MNNRYKELYDLADYCAGSLMAGGATEEQIQERAREVFAEMIVRECADLVRSYDHGYPNGPSKVIMAHFGVDK